MLGDQQRTGQMIFPCGHRLRLIVRVLKQLGALDMGLTL
jgi:hypothetical protein